MFKWLTTTKKGYTLVELMIVLVLLSLGAFALMNLITVAYRSLEKSEERYQKQAEVKRIADLIRDSRMNIASAQAADTFDDIRVVPSDNKAEVPKDATGEPNYPADYNAGASDNRYSYLYTKPSIIQVKDDTGHNVDVINGYYLYCLNRGTPAAIKVPDKNFEGNALYDAQGKLRPISYVPIFIDFEPMQQPQPEKGLGATVNSCGVMVNINALEDDVLIKKSDLQSGEKLNMPKISSDDIYYGLEVAYHFPNMITNTANRVVNYDAGKKSQAEVYDSSGKIVPNEFIPACDDGSLGCVLRVYSESIITGDTTESNITPPTMCFIATASYGHDSGEVGMLREFRDKCLLTNPLGSLFVKAYYKVSPPIADFIAENEALKAAVRGILKPVIVVAEYALNPEIRVEGAICLLVGFASLSGVTITLMAVNKRRHKVKSKR